MSLATQSVSQSPPAAKDASGTLAGLLGAGRPIVMGILNVTPDSFSDGGRFLDPAAAIEHARRMGAEDADMIDIGAESTRPYGAATPVSAMGGWLAADDRRFGLQVYPDSRPGIRPSQRAHQARESRDFWVRNLLGGQLPDVVIETRPVETKKIETKKTEKVKEKERTP